MSKPSISVTVRYGQWGEQSKTAVLPIDDHLMDDLLERVELSRDPVSLMLHGWRPGFSGFDSICESVEVRKKKFVLRKEAAEYIAKQLTDKLVEVFGSEDTLNGYSLTHSEKSA